MREYEYKYLLEYNVFKRVQESVEKEFPEVAKNEMLQINYYYDNDRFDLNKSGTTVRIRQRGNSLRLQIKKHMKVSKEYSSSTEDEYRIDEIYGALKFRGKKYHLQGALNTKRVSYSIEEGIKVEFDTNTYLGVEDYEIEIEFSEEKEQEVKNIIALLGLSSTIRGKGKATRFMNRKKSISKNVFKVKDDE